MSFPPLNQHTQLLRVEQVDQLSKSLPPISYDSVPFEIDQESKKHQRWRVRFMLANDPVRGFGLDLFDEVIFGRGTASFNLINLNRFDLDAGGVSRRHLMLRPTETNLYVIDMGSTNGTTKNGRSIGVNTPYVLVNGDHLSLGDLDFVIQIVERPNLTTGMLNKQEKPDIADALSQIAKAITSQLDLNEVLNQVAETAMALTAAGEAGIWLVDENNGQLFLEAQRGIADAKLRRMRLSMGEDSPASRVIRSGSPVRVQRQPGEERIKVMTNYLVEALVYTPITLGGVTFGVLSAAHRVPGKVFDKRDERLLSSIADFAAIAIQNARLFQSTDEALALRVQELSALNRLSRAVSSSLDLEEVFSVFIDQVNSYWSDCTMQLYLVDAQGAAALFSPSKGKNKVTSQLVRRGMVNKVATSGRTLVGFEELEAELTETIQGRLPISVACVPLMAKGRVVGVLALSNNRNVQFSDEDIAQLETFANPMATAVENARLFEESERQRAAIQATAGTLSQPLLILDNNGRILVANEAANKLLEANMAQLFEGISSGVGKTEELVIGKQTFLTTVEHLAEVGTIVVMQDITYVKQLEKERVEFIHLLSHDLRSPLTSIVGWAHLLPRVNELNEKGEQYIEGITKATSRMLDMINQLLRTATQADAVELVKVPCKLEEVVQKTLSDLEGAALSKQIQFERQIVGEPFDIVGDKDRLYHMALNLVSNAVKYSPAKTAVSVILEYDEGVVLRVQDQGHGIDEEELPHIFNRYYRGKAGRANDTNGVGLGLSGVWAIAEAHGGTAVVRNRPEGGAEFMIRLPDSLRAV